ncbi:MAG: UDP-N-acetylglucosamine 2-epimerase (non-hydrolyzing) [Anaerolineales bacterium]|jgi:UDP-N-acetylglucosamine 2-epimerase
MPVNILSIVGARPQFIKAGPVLDAVRQAGHQSLLIHTGQHYDVEMSQTFFDDMGIPAPDDNLGVGSGPHGWQTGQMMVGIERVLQSVKPDWVLVYGDTNSTLAGALAAAKLNLPLGHIEAGLRSYNREMPEEHNRILADRCSDLLFCPTRTAVENLAREGMSEGVRLVGDTMYDAVLKYAQIAQSRSSILDGLGLQPGSYLLATVHRAYNADRPENLRSILDGLAQTGRTVVFPVHPRTRKRIEALGGLPKSGEPAGEVRMIDPLGYLDMLMLEQNADIILTDSGGIQKEAYFFRVPCITLRPETEWVETVEAGWNILVGTDPARIVQAVAEAKRDDTRPPDLFGDGQASAKIVDCLATEARS